MHFYVEKLMSVSKNTDSILCFGMDPVIERMKIDPSKNLADEIVRYFTAIIHAITPKISAVKPNIAYYLQYGQDGLRALLSLLSHIKHLGLPIIIDAKLGDIDRSSAAYARFVFETLGGDAVTLNPYMGYDSLEPFFRYEGRGCYVLVLTSNPGASDFQLKRLESGEKFYERILSMVCNWSRTFSGVGAVIGATQEDFRACVSMVKDHGDSFPLLIPGVGAQGASYKTILEILNELGYESNMVRINVSSAISYAHEKYPSLKPDEAAFRAVTEITGN
ncbi:MAG: orotidine-5'-phosphate decarboxylase [Spirochaetota bacterium]